MCGGGGGDGPGAPLWIVSFSDMIANLVTFFIVMATFNAANAKGDKFKRFQVESEPGIFGGQSQAPRPELLQKPGDKHSRFGVNGPISPSERQELAENKLLDRMVQSKEYNVKPDFQRTKNGCLRIGLGEEGLFPPGSTEIRESGQKIIEEIGNCYRGEDVQILIEAHVDSVSWKGAGANSAEELSQSMAVSVARFLTSRCGIAPPRVSIRAFGATQPLAPNDTALGRSKNRRVEFVIGQDP